MANDRSPRPAGQPAATPNAVSNGKETGTSPLRWDPAGFKLETLSYEQKGRGREGKRCRPPSRASSPSGSTSHGLECLNNDQTWKSRGHVPKVTMQDH
jgi:hypothetical protein